MLLQLSRTARMNKKQSHTPLLISGLLSCIRDNHICYYKEAITYAITIIVDYSHVQEAITYAVSIIWATLMQAGKHRTLFLRSRFNSSVDVSVIDQIFSIANLS